MGSVVPLVGLAMCHLLGFLVMVLLSLPVLVATIYSKIHAATISV